LGICQDTLIEKKKEYSEFSEAISRGKAKGIQEIANALFEKAKRGNVPAMVFFLKARAKWGESTGLAEPAPIQQDADELRDELYEKLTRLANAQANQ
jgi:hypothetical protein